MTTLPTHIGQYEVLNEIGTGRFGTVYAARDPRLGTEVTVKVLRADLINDQAIIQLFKREANALLRLNHPNVIYGLSFDLHHSPPYLVTEQVKGRTLADQLAQKQTFSLPEALPLLRKIAAALDVAHLHQLIHRHLSPKSILITHDRQIKLIDVGLIKRTSTHIMNGSGGAVHVGHINYMAPEQTEVARQHEINSSTDIYAFGVIAYQMLAGSLPFEGSQEAVMVAHQAALPPNPRVFNPKLPPPVANVLRQVLCKQASSRFATATAFVRALEQAANNDNPTRVFSSTSQQNGAVSRNGASVAPTRQQLPAVSVPTGPFNTKVSSSEPATQVLQLPGSAAPADSGKRKYGKWVIALAVLLVLALLGGISANWLLSLDRVDRSEPEQVIPTVPDAQVLSEEGLYMRVGPDIKYEIVAMYPTDTALRIIGRDLESTWLQVETPDGQLGWMYGPLLNVNISLDSVPFVPPPPAPLRRQL